MYLSRIELFGFKSFPHKVTVEVGQGITAIVGPNGCGKTNIVDAIRWCLGEQSTKQLRSDKMEDVIFNGTRDEKPLSLAEVTLVFSNEEGRLPVEYQEVSVTRRLFRSGESEYLLNNKTCRLKDIVDLFLNTGLGADSYSIIESKMIETILSEDPSIRRSLFEEAAGVAKYRQQKKAAQRRLESTAEDLVRIQDIIVEVEKKLRSLRRQAAKARVYEKFRGELRELDLKLASLDRERLKRQEEELSASIEEAAVKRGQLAEAMDQKEEEISRAREMLEENESAIAQLQEEISQVSEEIRDRENRLAVIRERRSGIERSIQAREAEVQTLIAALGLVEENIRHLQSRVSQDSEELLGRTEELQRRQAELAALDAEITSGRAALAEAQRELMESVRQTSENREKLAGLEGRYQAALSEQQRLLEEKSELVGELEALNRQLEELNRNRQAQTHALGIVGQEIRELEARISELSQSLTDRERALAELGAEAAGLEKEQELLSELRQRRQGYGQAVQHLLDSHPELAERARPLAEGFTVKSDCQRAIQSLLGERLGWLAVADAEAMSLAIDWLRRAGCGWATLVPLYDLQAIKPAEAAPAAGQGIRGRAIDFIECREELRPLLTFLLHDALVVEDDVDILDLRHQYLQSRLANRRGEVAEPSGELTLGSPATGQFGLLERQQRLEELQGLIQSKRQEQAGLSSEIEKGRRRLKELEDRIESIRGQADEIQRQLNQTEKDLATLSARAEKGREREQQLERKLAALEPVLVSLSAEIGACRQMTLEFDESSLDERQSMDLRAQEIKALEQRRAELAREISEATLDLARLQSEQEQRRQEIRNLETRRHESMERIQQLRSWDEEAGRNISQIAEEDASLCSQLESLTQKRQELLSQREARQHQSQRSLADMKAAEDILHRTRLESDEIQNRLANSQLERSRLANERDNLRSRLAEEYEVELESLPLPEACPIEEARTRAADLRLRIKKLGGINFDALKELEDEENRYTFMCRQRDDLLAAKQDLVATIKRIDEEARSMFLATMEGIKKGFLQIFNRLFIGGEADIRLKGSDDPLEAEIEILATPMGKNMKSITLLSGGEKALTAIALLFGIYLVKPAPFCVLDEIDAPLDDANVQRFCAMLKDFTGSTQFMVITHNKRTMEIADRLYGVTMEQLGVSKVVSVKFN